MIARSVSVSTDAPAKRSESAVIGWCSTDRVLLCAALFLVIVGVRFLLIKDFASDLPFNDQWGAEAERLYKPYYNGTLSFSDWFAPSNEHRVFFTRLLSLALLKSNGQWDARLQMVVNAVFYSFFASALFLVLSKSRGARFNSALCAFMAVLFTLPFGWENTLWGFQVHFYFLTAFSTVTIWLLVNNPAWSWRWFAGCLIGGASLFVMASGFMAAAAVIVLSCFLVARGRRLRELWPTIAICLVTIGAGLLLMVKVERHEVLKAHSVFDFFRALGYCLSWPSVMFSPWWGVVNWLPFIVLAVYFLMRLLPEERMERFILALGIWELLQLLATAYSRAMAVNSPRYADMISIGFLVNFMSFSLLAKGRELSAMAKLAGAVFVVSWLAVNTLGFYRLTSSAVDRGIPFRANANAIEEARTAAYVNTGDMNWLTVGKSWEFDIPEKDPQKLARLVQDPDIRRILPVSVREPLAMEVRFGAPLLLRNTDVESLAPPHYGERIWGEKPGAADSAKGFECSATKRQGLPYIFLLVAGDYRRLSVIDARNGRHSVVPVPLKGQNLWQPVYAYCPGPVVRIEAAPAGNTPPVAFTEPKEMGRLSLYALLLADKAGSLIVAGVVLAGVAIVHAIANLRGRSARVDDDSEKSLLVEH